MTDDAEPALGVGPEWKRHFGHEDEAGDSWCVCGRTHPIRPVHVAADEEVWAEELGDAGESTFRVTRIDKSGDAPMRSETIHARSLGTLVRLLARGDFYCVLVQKL